MKAIVLLNLAAGTSGTQSGAEDERAVLAAFSAENLPVEVRRVDGPDLTRTTKEIVAECREDQRVVVAAGGDDNDGASRVRVHFRVKTVTARFRRLRVSARAASD